MTISYYHHQQNTQTTTTTTTNPHPTHQLITRHHPSPQLLTRPLNPFITLAAYASLFLTALSALIALILASYGLSAWDDAKLKLFGLRGLIGKGLDVGKDIVDTLTSKQPSLQSDPNRTTIPSRPQGPINTSFHSTCQRSTSTTGYEVPSMHLDHEQLETDQNQTEGLRRRTTNSNHTPPSPPPSQQQPSTLPPRPPLSILIASLFLTLIVLSARLMVVWWMGQQAQKNPTNAFRNAQRAYFDQANQEEFERDHPHPSHPHLPRPNIMRNRSSYEQHPHH